VAFRSLREEAKTDKTPVAEPGSLMAAVLKHDPDAFSYTPAGMLGLRCCCMPCYFLLVPSLFT